MLIGAKFKIIYILKSITYLICAIFLRSYPKVLVRPVVNRDRTKSIDKGDRSEQKTVVYGIQQENFNYLLNWKGTDTAKIIIVLL